MREVLSDQLANQSHNGCARRESRVLNTDSCFSGISSLISLEQNQL